MCSSSTYIVIVRMLELFLEYHKESSKPVVTSYSFLLIHACTSDDYLLETTFEEIALRKTGKQTTLFRYTENS